jgi:Arc/MetJ-type ribon-helix-helix transcriptional regulator
MSSVSEQAVSGKGLPMSVSPGADFSDFIRQKVESGQFPSEEAVLEEAMRRFQLADVEEDVAADKTSADPIDYEAIAYCARMTEGRDVPSLEEVRRILSKVPGSLAQDVAEEREDRF